MKENHFSNLNNEQIDEDYKQDVIWAQEQEYLMEEHMRNIMNKPEGIVELEIKQKEHEKLPF